MNMVSVNVNMKRTSLGNVRTENDSCPPIGEKINITYYNHTRQR